jgi:hypothetical protein
MSQQKLLERVIGVLEKSEIPYMVTGSIVSSLQGEPRSTHDVDMIVAIRKSQAHTLATAFSSGDFYLDEQSIEEAIDKQSMFNLLDISSGDKVDFWMLTDESFDVSRFSRKYVEEFRGFKMYVSSPEDTILAKLRWARLSGGSEKQFMDVLRVYEVQHEKLDPSYLEHWTKQLGVGSLWQRVKDEAEIS